MAAAAAAAMAAAPPFKASRRKVCWCGIVEEFARGGGAKYCGQAGGVSEGGSARDFFGKDEEEQTVVALSAEHNELEGEIGGE